MKSRKIKRTTRGLGEWGRKKHAFCVRAKRRRIVQEQQKKRGGCEGWRKGADGRNLGTKAKVAERDRQIEREREKQKGSPTLRGRRVFFFFLFFRICR